ncbi:tyrosine-type recombinase/integrase [Ruminococcus sp.]|uniref:tyrosine-type recombinase/integrase n=1 Tax=Ruminococcus sp. TaxID=41978 RepID=UPI003A8E4BB4
MAFRSFLFCPFFHCSTLFPKCKKCASYFSNLHTLFYKLLSCISFRSEKPCYSDSLFLTIEREPITSNAIKMLFQRLKISSGISRLYPHLLRHTFATNYIIQGGNLEVLRVLLGHSSISITQIYIHLATQMQLVNNKFDSHLDTLT